MLPGSPETLWWLTLWALPRDMMETPFRCCRLSVNPLLAGAPIGESVVVGTRFLHMPVTD